MFGLGWWIGPVKVQAAVGCWCVDWRVGCRLRGLGRAMLLVFCGRRDRRRLGLLERTLWWSWRFEMGLRVIVTVEGLVPKSFGMRRRLIGWLRESNALAASCSPLQRGSKLYMVYRYSADVEV
jgi:hypothetical protein